MLGGLDTELAAAGFFVLLRLRRRGDALVLVIVVSVVHPASKAAAPQPAVFRKSRRFIRETL
jgi:hypothetical protein